MTGNLSLKVIEAGARAGYPEYDELLDEWQKAAIRSTVSIISDAVLNALAEATQVRPAPCAVCDSAQGHKLSCPVLDIKGDVIEASSLDECTCDTPIIVCDKNGCRCSSCGFYERMMISPHPAEVPSPSPVSDDPKKPEDLKSAQPTTAISSNPRNTPEANNG